MAPAAAAPAGVARLVALGEGWLAQVAARDEALEPAHRVLSAHACTAPRAAVMVAPQLASGCSTPQAAAAVTGGELAGNASGRAHRVRMRRRAHAAARDADAGDAAAAGRARYAIEHLLRRWSAADPDHPRRP